MRVSIEKMKGQEIQAGNFLVCETIKDSKLEIFIIKQDFTRTFSLVDIEDGVALFSGSKKEIIESLKVTYKKIGYVKKEDIEIKIDKIDWSLCL